MNKIWEKVQGFMKSDRIPQRNDLERNETSIEAQKNVKNMSNHPSRQVVWAQPTVIKDEGFLKKNQSIVEENGEIKSIVEEPLLIDCTGTSMKNVDDLAGRCQICGGYVKEGNLYRCDNPECSLYICLNCQMPLLFDGENESHYCKNGCWDKFRNMQNTWVINDRIQSQNKIAENSNKEKEEKNSKE